MAARAMHPRTDATDGRESVSMFTLFGGTRGMRERLKHVPNYHHRVALMAGALKLATDKAHAEHFRPEEAWAMLRTQVEAKTAELAAKLDGEVPGSGMKLLDHAAAMDARRAGPMFMFACGDAPATPPPPAVRPAALPAMPPAVPPKRAVCGCDDESLSSVDPAKLRTTSNAHMEIADVPFQIRIADLREILRDSRAIIGRNTLDDEYIERLWSTAKGVNVLIRGVRLALSGVLSVLLQCEALWVIALQSERPVDATRYARACRFVGQYTQFSWGGVEDTVRAAFSEEFYACFDATGAPEIRRMFPPRPVRDVARQ
jgi:hypothetical protein